MISLQFLSTIINIWYLSFLNSINQSYKKYIIWLYPKQIITISEEDRFNQSIKSRFLEFIKNNSLNHSENINPIFYDKKEFTEYMKNPNTKQERLWKTRIQMITTPRGNIIMYYDPYKLGFSYYCDQNVISYDILNSCAMKYVMIFKCRDFFTDEYILPEDSKNPLKIHFLDEPKKTQLIHSKTSPFMRPKQNSKTQPANPPDPDRLRNKFIYLGNMRNFSPCQKEQKTIKGFVSVLLDGIDNQLSWSNYKNNIMINPLT
jgi:hypothetical protein